jgi:hypothetical protein
MANIDLSFPVLNGLSLDDIVGIFCGESDPSANNEIAPVGSLYLRHTGASTGELWIKVGIADSAWEQTATASIPQLEDVLGAGNVTNGNNIVISNGDEITDLVANSLVYPTLDGTVNQALVTDGAGNLSFANITATLGSVDEHTDVDTSTNVPVNGDTLKWNGLNWTPSSNGGAGSDSNNYIFAYDTTTQNFAVANTAQTLLFNTIGQMDGWVENSSEFTASVGGQFAATIEVNVEKGGGGQVTTACICELNTIEVPGSHQGMNITSNNTAFSLSRTFLFTCSQNDVLRFRIGGATTQGKVTPSPVIAGISTPISTTLTIRRLT